MNNFLTALAVILVLVLTVLFFGPLLINWDDYRRDVEVRLAEILGTKVELDGSLNVRVLPTPYVRAENLRLGDSGIQGQPILQVKELTLWLAVPPLFKGVVEASQLTLDQPKLVLQFDEAGRPLFQTVRKKAERKKNSRPGGVSSMLSGFSFSPDLISLKNVRLIDGEVVLRAQGGKGKAKKARLYQLPISGIEGVFSAKTLKGPFQFDGRFKRDDQPHLLRLAIGAEVDETFPLQGRVTLPQGKTVSFDGKIVEEKKRLKVLGSLKAGLGGAGVPRRTVLGSVKDLSAQQKQAEGRVADPDAVKETGEDFELWRDEEGRRTDVVSDEVVLTSSVRLSAHEAQFDQLVVRGGSLAQPMTVKGAVEMTWRRDLRLNAHLEGQVVDVNRFAVQAGRASGAVLPWSAFFNFTDGFIEELADFDQVDIRADAAQLTVGRGDVRDFQLVLQGAGDQLRVRRFEGRVPGSGRVSLNGVFAQKGKRPGFKGALFLRGLQFQEFMAWAWPEATLTGDVLSGKYMLSGQVMLDDGRLVVDQFTSDFNGMALSGQVRHVVGKEQVRSRPATQLVLNVGAVNLAQLLGRDVPFKDYQAAVKDVLALGGAQGENGVTGTGAVPFEVKLYAQRVIFSDAVQKDVMLQWQGVSGAGQVTAFSMVSEAGLRLAFGGAVQDGSEGDQFIIEANTADALRELVHFSNAREVVDQGLSDQLLSRVLPLRMAVQRRSYESGVQYRVDGMLAGSDAAFSILAPKLTSDLGDAGSPSKNIQIFGGVENADGPALARLFLPPDMIMGSSLSEGEQSFDEEKALVSFLASGSFAKGFQGQLNFKQKDLSLLYEGVFGLKGQTFASDGVLRLKSSKTADAVRLFGFDGLRLTPAQQGPASGEMRFVHTEKGYAISDLKARFGSDLIKGTGLMQVVGEQERLQLALATSKLSLDMFFAALSEQSGEGGDSLWSSDPFAKEKADDRDARERAGVFSLALNELLLTDQLSLKDARIHWRHEAGRIEVSKIEGKLFGGVFQASGLLQPVVDGFGFQGKVTLTDARLEEVGAQSEINFGQGLFDLSLELNGNGASPAVLVASLFGDGVLKIKKGALRQISPKRLRQVALAYLQRPQEGKATLTEKLRIAVDQAEALPVGAVTLDVRVIDGDLKIQKSDLGVRPGLLGFQGQMNFGTLQWRGVWQIDAGGKALLAGLPPISQQLNGGIGAKGDVEVKVEVDEFVHALDLKQKERQVEALEKARLKGEQEEMKRAREQAQREREEKARAEAKQKAEKKPVPQNSVIDWSELPELVP